MNTHRDNTSQTDGIRRDLIDFVRPIRISLTETLEGWRVGDVTFSDGLQEFCKQLVRLLLFSCLFLVALRINCWRVRRHLGNLLLAALRCLAVVALVEAVRVAQIPHGPVRIMLIIATQYVVCCTCVLWLFSMTIREVILFVTSCTIGVAVLWVGAQLGTWIA